jgi:hypothetical protein
MYKPTRLVFFSLNGLVKSMKVSDELASRDERDRDRVEENKTMLRVLRS